MKKRYVIYCMMNNGYVGTTINLFTAEITNACLFYSKRGAKQKAVELGLIMIKIEKVYYNFDK